MEYLNEFEIRMHRGYSLCCFPKKRTPPEADQNMNTMRNGSGPF